MPEWLAMGGAFLQVLVVIYIVMGVLGGHAGVQTGPWVIAEPVAGIPLAFHFETLSLLFALVASMLWFATTLYAAGYMRAHGETHLDCPLRAPSLMPPPWGLGGDAIVVWTLPNTSNTPRPAVKITRTSPSVSRPR